VNRQNCAVAVEPVACFFATQLQPSGTVAVQGAPQSFGDGSRNEGKGRQGKFLDVIGDGVCPGGLPGLGLGDGHGSIMVHLPLKYRFGCREPSFAGANFGVWVSTLLLRIQQNLL
jgi:hypothetical protein